MNNSYPNDIVRFIVLILVQVLILNNIYLGGYINPYLYVMFILQLSFDIAPWIILFIAFGMGLTIDMFSNTVGLHTSALVLIAFLRPYFINLMVPKDDFNKFPEPSIRGMGFARFAYYAFFLTTIHHLVLFYLWKFSFSNFFGTFFRAFMSILFTMILILMTQQLIVSKQKKNTI